MKNTLIRCALLAGMLLMFLPGISQKERYQAIQGLGYLHTQVTILLENWEMHPLNEFDLDEFEKDYKRHFVEEITHDEEWVEFMLVEDNLLFQFEEHIDADVEDALRDNLEFYRKVINLLRNSEEMDIQLTDLRNELQGADSRLYEQIYPALCK